MFCYGQWQYPNLHIGGAGGPAGRCRPDRAGRERRGARPPDGQRGRLCRSRRPARPRRRVQSGRGQLSGAPLRDLQRRGRTGRLANGRAERRAGLWRPTDRGPAVAFAQRWHPQRRTGSGRRDGPRCRHHPAPHAVCRGRRQRPGTGGTLTRRRPGPGRRAEKNHGASGEAIRQRQKCDGQFSVLHRQRRVQ